MIITWICSSVWSKTWVKKIWQISLLEFCLDKAAPSPYGERYHVLKHSNESLASILWMKLHQHKLALNSYFYLFIYLHIYLFIYLFEKKFFSEFDSVITRIKSGSCKFRDLLPLLASRVCHQEQKADYVLHV